MSDVISILLSVLSVLGLIVVTLALVYAAGTLFGGLMADWRGALTTDAEREE